MDGGPGRAPGGRKAFTRQRDELRRQRRALPWVEITAGYVFDTPNGPVPLSELFGTHHPLLVYHFMMGPDWVEGWPACSFWADNFDGVDVHLAHATRHWFLSFGRLSYQTFARGLDMINGAYHMLDLTAGGRDEDGLDWAMAWPHRHDAYRDGGME